jgi:polyferredoxin
MKIITKRRWFQALSTLGINIYIPTFLKGEIYQGSIKGTCVPVLNCYSCPSAIGACPIGALQNSFATMRFNLSIANYQIGLYVIGFLGAVGSLVGRLPCGWLCPFGFLQEMLYKIPSPKLSIPRILTYLKYAVLVVTVIGLPFFIVDQFNLGETWFCKWICPAGTLEAGVPLASLNENVRGLLGPLFIWKMSLLVLFLIWMVFSQRPFCRTTCPLGAIFGLFNKMSVFRMVIHEERCTKCLMCLKNCPVEIKAFETPNSPECVRCLKCITACEYGTIEYEFLRKKKAQEKAEQPA